MNYGIVNWPTDGPEFVIYMLIDDAIVIALSAHLFS